MHKNAKNKMTSRIGAKHEKNLERALSPEPELLFTGISYFFTLRRRFLAEAICLRRITLGG